MLLPDSINIALEVEKYLTVEAADADDDLIALDNIVLLWQQLNMFVNSFWYFGSV